MSATLEPVVPLVQVAAIEPAACRRAALVLAAAQDRNGGSFQASMATIAGWVGMSQGQTRKHVHALFTMGVLKVLANGNGGSSKALPLYQFDPLRLRALAHQPGITSDLFNTAPAPRRRFYAVDTQNALKQMATELHGRPGQRVVRFVWETKQGDVAYGWGPLQMLLLPPFAKGAWTGQLNPQPGAPAGAKTVNTAAETVEELRAWAQDVALGRMENGRISNNQPAHPQGGNNSDH
ncbi:MULTISPECIES: hypothetical protein [unclassified Acidovorax]|uniref:hypothetical protein n=1 Tax=unclassified Acidovorax TaxID=2684926 RepID=UPI001C45D6C4|nr:MULTISPECIES: hypothetical protein [unclassified Acidovorax]MBV7428068.1 hypothetical protein [Acidovorax sp. sif0732]MBV7449325.1 hypothetical protein [Acidovorax sp. sif0715]